MIIISNVLNYAFLYINNNHSPWNTILIFNSQTPPCTQGKGLGTLVQTLGSANAAIMIIFVFAHMQSHIGVQDQENAPICPLNLSLLREGFKNQIAERKANKISHLSNNETEW